MGKCIKAQHMFFFTFDLWQLASWVCCVQCFLSKVDIQAFEVLNFISWIGVIFQDRSSRLICSLLKWVPYCITYSDIWNSSCECTEMLPKLFWPTIRKNCFSDQEKLLKFEAEGRELAKFLRWLEQFVPTVKGQNNFW